MRSKRRVFDSSGKRAMSKVSSFPMGNEMILMRRVTLRAVVSPQDIYETHEARDGLSEK